MPDNSAEDVLEETAEVAGIGAAATPPSPKVGGRVRFHGLITLSVMAATIMQALDTTIANVALPYMEGSLSASRDQITWVLTSYIIAAAIMLTVTASTLHSLRRNASASYER